MTDYQTQYDSEPLTATQKSSNLLEVNPPNNFNATNPDTSVTYKTPLNYGFMNIIFIIIGLFLSGLLIYSSFTISSNTVYFSIGSIASFVFVIVGYSICSLGSIYTKIHIDKSAGIITIEKVKTFVCFNVSVKIPINKIDQVFNKEEKKKDEDDKSYFIFKILFRLLNGNEIEVCELENLNECKKAFNIIKSALPQNITFNDIFSH